MTVSAASAAYQYPLVQRTSGPRQPTPDDRVYDPVLDPAVNPALRNSATTEATEEMVVTAKKPASEGGLSFWDFLDLINPLQHIPVVNTIYRDLTGDTIKTPIQLIGSTIVGGPIGFATAMVDSIIEEATGTDMGGHAMALLKGEKAKPTTAPMTEPQTQVASAAQEFVPQDPYATPASAPTMQVAASALPAAHTAGANRAVANTSVANTPASNVAISNAANAYAANANVASENAAAPNTTANRARAVAAAKQGAANAPQKIIQAAPQAVPGAPNEADAFVKTAQVAAQANVFPTFKRTNTLPSGQTSPAQAQAAQAQAAQAPQNAAAQMNAARNGRFMPLNRAAIAAPARSAEQASTSPAELRARTRFSPGPVNPGGATLAPATLAAATAAQSKTANRPEDAAAVAPQAPSVSAQDAYSYGRDAANTAANRNGPTDVPVWFDSAMMNAIDKYKAMQNAK